MLAQPIFNFTEELVRQTASPTGGSCGSSSNNNSSSASSAVSSSLPTGRMSLKRPSKLELTVNLNDQQSGLTPLNTPLSINPSMLVSSSPNNSVGHHHPQFYHHHHHFDRNNNSLNSSNNTSNNNNGIIGNASSQNNLFALNKSLDKQQVPNSYGVDCDSQNNEASSMLSSSAPSGARPTIAGKKKKRRCGTVSEQTTHFSDVYSLTGEELGKGAYGVVYACRNIYTGIEYAVKIIDKYRHPNRERVFKEIEIFQNCRGCPNILKIIEFFEETEKFYVVFEKMEGGPLLTHIERRGHLTEHEASLITRDIATALHYLHSKGMAHRDLKPENILCQYADSIIPVKICDFDLGSSQKMKSHSATPVTTPVLCTPVGSAEYLAPEVVEAFINDMSYDKRCDLWSLGVIVYIMLSGKCPFVGKCGRDCGWERGEECRDCQEYLFRSIQDGSYEFPADDWAMISEEAKDLIRHLLEHDVTMRYSASDVLRHSWIVSGHAPDTQLCTPSVLKRNNSVRDIVHALGVNKQVEMNLMLSSSRIYERSMIEGSSNDQVVSTGTGNGESALTPTAATGFTSQSSDLLDNHQQFHHNTSHYHLAANHLSRTSSANSFRPNDGTEDLSGLSTSNMSNGGSGGGGNVDMPSKIFVLGDDDEDRDDGGPFDDDDDDFDDMYGEGNNMLGMSPFLKQKIAKQQELKRNNSRVVTSLNMNNSFCSESAKSITTLINQQHHHHQQQSSNSQAATVPIDIVPNTVCAVMQKDYDDYDYEDDYDDDDEDCSPDYMASTLKENMLLSAISAIKASDQSAGGVISQSNSSSSLAKSEASATTSGIQDRTNNGDLDTVVAKCKNDETKEGLVSKQSVTSLSSKKSTSSSSSKKSKKRQRKQQKIKITTILGLPIGENDDLVVLKQSSSTNEAGQSTSSSSSSSPEAKTAHLDQHELQQQPQQQSSTTSSSLLNEKNTNTLKSMNEEYADEDFEFFLDHEIQDSKQQATANVFTFQRRMSEIGQQKSFSSNGQNDQVVGEDNVEDDEDDDEEEDEDEYNSHAPMLMRSHAATIMMMGDNDSSSGGSGKYFSTSQATTNDYFLASSVDTVIMGTGYSGMAAGASTTASSFLRSAMLKKAKKNSSNAKDDTTSINSQGSRLKGEHNNAPGSDLVASSFKKTNSKKEKSKGNKNNNKKISSQGGLDSVSSSCEDFSSASSKSSDSQHQQQQQSQTVKQKATSTFMKSMQLFNNFVSAFTSSNSSSSLQQQQQQQQQQQPQSTATHDPSKFGSSPELLTAEQKASVPAPPKPTQTYSQMVQSTKSSFNKASVVPTSQQSQQLNTKKSAAGVSASSNSNTSGKRFKKPFIQNNNAFKGNGGSTSGVASSMSAPTSTRNSSYKSSHDSAGINSRPRLNSHNNASGGGNKKKW